MRLVSFCLTAPAASMIFESGVDSRCTNDDEADCPNEIEVDPSLGEKFQPRPKIDDDGHVDRTTPTIIGSRMDSAELDLQL
jgi:hypothetical protein